MDLPYTISLVFYKRFILDKDPFRDNSFTRQ
jgi:hypothetical protein